jgi:catechol 2,3-dioxygenase-like lactoylglutathione lyase family enzyme
VLVPKARAVHHIALVVSDLVAAERFYGDVLGLAVLRRWFESDGTTPRSIWFEVEPGTFLAVERGVAALRPESDCAPTQGGWHLVALGITRSERDLWRERLEQAGFPCTDESRYTLYCRDPEGNRVGLSHWPEPSS